MDITVLLDMIPLRGKGTRPVTARSEVWVQTTNWLPCFHSLVVFGALWLIVHLHLDARGALAEDVVAGRAGRAGDGVVADRGATRAGVDAKDDGLPGGLTRALAQADGVEEEEAVVDDPEDQHHQDGQDDGELDGGRTPLVTSSSASAPACSHVCTLLRRHRVWASASILWDDAEGTSPKRTISPCPDGGSCHKGGPFSLVTGCRGSALTDLQAEPRGELRELGVQLGDVLGAPAPRLPGAPSYPQHPGGPVRLQVEPRDEVLAQEERQHVVAVHPLLLGHVDLEPEVEAEERPGAVALPDERVER